MEITYEFVQSMDAMEVAEVFRSPELHDQSMI